MRGKRFFQSNIEKKILYFKNKAKESRKLAKMYRGAWKSLYKNIPEHIHKLYVRAAAPKKLPPPKKLNHKTPPTEQNFHNALKKISPHPHQLDRAYKLSQKHNKRANRYEKKIEQLEKEKNRRENLFGFSSTLKQVIRFNAMY